MATPPTPNFGLEWPEFLQTKLIVLDFDKTITNKHTRGAIFHLAGMEVDVLKKNFADLDFFKVIIPIICRHASVAIATYADEEQESLCSGVALVRRYLDVAFDGKSQQYIPDENIEAWNPENRQLDPKKVGKNMHLDALRKRIGNGCKKSEIALFDDTDLSIELAKKAGYIAQFVEPAKGVEENDTANPEGPVITTGFCLDVWNKFCRAQYEKANDKGCTIS